jgi:phage terminase large subunit-like protein
MRSYFALAKMAAAPFGLVLRGDGVRKQVSLEEAIQIVNSHASFDHPEAIYIETWGAGEVFLQQLRRELPGLNLRSWKDPADKTRRFLAMARHFQHGRVRISDEETEFLKVFEDEWVRYEPGNKSVTNDTLDAASLAIAAAGINVYSTYDEPPPVPETLPGGREPWGGAWGMPRTRFRG